MVGIKSFGVYLPYYRLNRADVGKFWSSYQTSGERTVANFDEDTLTMAVEACRDCLGGLDKDCVERFYLASTTFPYSEKQSSALVATALDLPKQVLTTDISGSLRSTSNAIMLALDSIRGKSARNVLIGASDMRLSLPNGSRELEFGDGAAALLLGDSDVIATIDHVFSMNEEIYDIYRPSGEKFVRFWEDRFVREMGYGKIVPSAVMEALKAFSLNPKDFSRALFYASNPGYTNGVVQKLGFDPKIQAADSLWGLTGNMGSAHGLALLAQALESAKVGDKILWVSYGDGCDVLAVSVKKGIEQAQQKQSFKRNLDVKAFTTYQKYLRWRDIIQTDPPKRPRMEQPSAVALYRDQKSGLALNGSKCKKCGTVQYPAQRICMECESKDNFEYYSFADKQGKIVTFSHDNLAVSADPPTTLAAVDFDGGGRIMLDVTDRDPDQIKVGTPVEMTFRRFREVEGIRVYWWKSRPIR
ncbi:MAG: hydroxymethylglutaryl-CoA synthase family protein [Deltaproteobacteria bacterium]|nr:hydroxymethylglutaryl-CoA synthase family protein [Deltaproteobacteria bacterium]